MLNVGGDVDGPDGIQPAETPSVVPIHEPPDGAVVSLPAAGVADGDYEEVDQEPRGAFSGLADHRRQAVSDLCRAARRRVDGEFLGRRISCFRVWESG